MMRDVDTQVAIVGAGPAGMAAAVELARAGARVVVFDEAPGPGGQIYRQPPSGMRMQDSALLHPPSHVRGDRLLAAVQELDIEFRGGVTVWGVEPGRLEFEEQGVGMSCRWERLVLATGAYDRSVAFPGWTLPGVITAGAAQVMVRGYLVAPGTRALVAGTGPLLLPTLTALAAAGVDVVAGLEACPRSRALRALPGVMVNRARRREAWHYARAMLGKKLPYSMGWAVFAAKGEGRVQSAVIGRLDREGRPRRETAREVDVDLICTGFGLCPSVELASLVGCEMHDLPVRGGWVPTHDERMETSVPGVFVAGEIAGIGGADVAALEGKLAGLSVVADLGMVSEGGSGAVAATQKACRRERRAADAMLGVFAVPPGLTELADDATVVCRCEDVTYESLREGVDLYGVDLRSAKMATRAGMGPCQGRICQPLLADLLRYRLGGAGPSLCPSTQVPAKPVAVATILGGDSAEGGAPFSTKAP